MSNQPIEDDMADPTPTPVIGIPKVPRLANPHQGMSENSIVTVNGWKALLARYGPGAVAAGYLIYYLTQTQGAAIAKIIDNQTSQATQLQAIISGHEMQQRALDALVIIARANCVNQGKDEAARSRCLQ